MAVNSNLASLTLSMQRATSPLADDAGAGPSDTRLKNALTALESLKRPASDAAEERKAAAAKKVEALKARIAMLRMGGGDPVATARAVAALARELGSAVKAYAAAGGGFAAMGMWAAIAAPAEAATPPVAPQVAESVAVEMGVETRADEDSPEETSATPADPYRQVIERMQTEAADRARRNGASEADARFATDVKGLAAELKAILREAQRKAKLEQDPIGAVDEQAADQALSQVADAVSEVEPAASLDGVVVGAGLSISI